MVFTSHAHIGILTYDPLSLNCAYCAPNKIFEYSKYGLPVLGNDIPGLRREIEGSRFGAIVDEKIEESIVEGIKKIEDNYETFSQNAISYYEGTDTVSTVKDIFGLS